MRRVSGFGFFPGGAGLLPLKLPILSLLVGTVAPALSEGFLCVISSGLTLRRPLVTASPLFSSLNTASMPPAGAAALGAADSRRARFGGGPGGGGGGAPPAAGGGGGPGEGAEEEVATAAAASLQETPEGFQMRPWGKVSWMYWERSLKIW